METKLWGINKDGQNIKEDDMLVCGNGFDTWITHVQFDYETGKWHREEDYFNSKVIGSYAE